MMKKRTGKLVSLLLTLALLLGMIPSVSLTAHAAHRCPDCEEWIDGSPYCSECFICDQCVEMCYECGKCVDCTGAEICDGCTGAEGGNFCTNCAEEKGAHCPDCGTCYYIAESWCGECGACEGCTYICDDCSVNLGFGLLCWDCAVDKDGHCPGCGNCYFDEGLWCQECKLCVDCSEHDQECSAQAGELLCKECAAERGNHCPDCSECYFEVGSWCGECGKCADCSPACLSCCEELGEIICEECAIEAGMHCSECSSCYDGGEYCTECGVCAACMDICSTDELCIECAVAGGYHCPGCEECGDQVILCENCGERCNECADAFCENCNLCSECVLICQGCGSCEVCAEICPNCEEYCSECEGLCDDCELCLICCADIAGFAGCDCTEWVCVESGDWDAHFGEEHTDNTPSSDHAVRPSPIWNYDFTHHWHDCVYCQEDGHLTGRAEHTPDASGVCTVCHFAKDAKIRIIAQPKNVKGVKVTSADEEYDESNLARFTVEAGGVGELTYTWYMGYYHHGYGEIRYSALTDPAEGEKFDGPELLVLAPTDACVRDWYVCCVISDEAGNEVRSNEVTLSARHDFQYYKWFRTGENPYELAERNRYGHVLVCVGEDCEKTTTLRAHEDEDRDGFCDICDYEIGKILITEQPKDVTNVYVRSAIENYDESNIAHFSVEAQGESELTYTWCRKMYVSGVLTYVPLEDPVPMERYDGPDLYLLVPTDACCVVYTYACIITDEEGNETRTVDVQLKGRHNYQYFKDYLTTRENPYYDAERNYIGHILTCVGEGCGKVSRVRKHEDLDNDYFCDICSTQRDFSEISLTVTVPKEGELPKYSVGTDSVAYYALGGSGNFTRYRFWFVSDNGTDNWELIDETTPFVAGKYYKFLVQMGTRTGYTFPIYNSEPNFWAKVNGDYVRPKTIDGMDPSRYVAVEYEFGECNDSVIENIVIENVVLPVAGEKPSYTATIRGSGYYIDTDKNEYEDIYWKNPSEKWYYIKNGIGWLDMTDFDWVYEDEVFIPGHEYKVRVYLRTEDGYTFHHDKWLEMLFTASVNGYGAEGNTTTSDGLTNQIISAAFTCPGKEISSVSVYGLSVPRAGETPDYTAVTDLPDWYQLDPDYGGTGGILWYRSDGTQMEPTDTFVEGESYRVELKVIPTKLGGANTSRFTSPLSAYVNGRQVVACGDWDMVYASEKAVYIYYTFSGAAAAPVTGPKTVFSWDGDSCTVTVPALETGVAAMAVSYREGRMVTCAYVAGTPVTLENCDAVRVFYYDSAFVPVYPESESTK